MVRVELIWGGVSRGLDGCGRRRRSCLLGVTGKVVGGLAGTGVALGDAGVAAVVGLEDRELPARGVPELDVELAVLALAGGRETGARLGDKLGVEEGDGGQVGRQLAGDGVGRAARAGIGNAGDLDLMAGGAGSEILARSHGLDLGGEGGGKASKEGEDVRQMHLDRWEVVLVLGNENEVPVRL